ncbi:MAG: ABC transporter ATP-binding protein [Chloroflexota bacterium]|nr:ABC transporter ATP-binding protein [Chloroflexota bacterium]
MSETAAQVRDVHEASEESVNEAVLQVKDLHVYYYTEAGVVKAVDGVTFDLDRGVKMGLVGESGCGKSTLAMSLMRMIKRPGRIESGQALINGRDDLASVSDERMRELRLREISLIPQGAMNSLNPVMRVKDQLLDGLEDHGVKLNGREGRERVNALLESVDLDLDVADMYPHELSGGMKQRVCVAIAISMEPSVLLADEPTSALDVVVQRQVMATIERLQAEMGISMILIGHDMGLMAQSVDQLAVMYAGRLAEVGDVHDIFEEPLHPYTELLISTLPTLGRRGEFTGIPGITPALVNPPSGCLFHPRCPHAMDICSEVAPTWQEIRPDHWVACHLYGGE